MYSCFTLKKNSGLSLEMSGQPQPDPKETKLNPNPKLLK